MDTRTHRAMPNPSTEVTVRITGEALRHLRTIAATAAAVSADKAAEAQRQAAAAPDPKAHKAYLAVARVHAEARRIARGLADELDQAHKGLDPLVGYSIDDNRRADQATDLAAIRHKEGR